MAKPVVEKKDCEDLVGKPLPAKRTGRPSTYSEAVANDICERIALGNSLRSICMGDDMPHMSTVFKWLGQQPTFAENYTRAREAQADAIVDDILDIADDKSLDPNDRRIRIDTRKWLAGKMRPKKYSDKVLLGSDPDNPLPDATLKIDVTALAEQLRRRATLPADNAPPAIEHKSSDDDT